MLADTQFSFKAYALSLASKGFKVFPCKCKKPLTTHGWKDATTDPAQIISWWEATPDAQIGINPSPGIFVLDVDPRHGGDKTLADLEAKNSKMPLTPTALTGGNGNHYWVKTNADGITSRNIAPGLDVKAHNGYVIAPPSIHHETGKAYTWLHGLDTPIADAPAWLVDMALAKDMPKAKTSTPIKSDAFSFTWQSEENDFASHPGAQEGQRNATLCRLIGIHLDRGDNVKTIETLALQWAGRCNPPYPDDEVMKTLETLHAKSIGKGEYRPDPEPKIEIEDPDDDSPVPKPPALSPRAFYGIIGDYVRAIEPHTEADPAAILISALVAFGNAVGRLPFFTVEADEHHANLFLACVGQSSHSRKGVSLGRALALFDGNYCKNNIISGLSSGEGVINAVRDAEMRLDIKKGVMEVVDPGVEDKRCLVAETEFAQTLAVKSREKNILSAILRNAWDGKVLRAMTVKPRIATDAHISIIGHITRQELSISLNQSDCFNGFANRFLWLCTRRSKLLATGGPIIDLSGYRQAVADAIANASNVGKMQFSTDALGMWTELYAQLETERPGLWGAVTGRASPITLRLAMIYALADGSAIIEKIHLVAAYAVWEFAEASAKYIFGTDEPMGTVETKVYGKVCETPGLSRKQVFDAFGRNTPMKEIGDALASLRDRGKVYARRDNQTGGRPCERWYPGREPTPDPGRPNVQTSEVPAETSADFRRSDVDAPSKPEPTPETAMTGETIDCPAETKAPCNGQAPASIFERLCPEFYANAVSSSYTPLQGEISSQDAPSPDERDRRFLAELEELERTGVKETDWQGEFITQWQAEHCG